MGATRIHDADRCELALLHGCLPGPCSCLASRCSGHRPGVPPSALWFHECHHPREALSAWRALEGRLQELCGQAPWREGGAGQQGPRGSSLPGGRWPENTGTQLGVKKTQISPLLGHREAGTRSGEGRPWPLPAGGRVVWLPGELAAGGGLCVCLSGGCSGENGPRSCPVFEDQDGPGRLLVTFRGGPSVCSQELLRHEHCGGRCVCTCVHM